jgi:integrase
MPEKINLTDVGIRALQPPKAGQITVWDKSSPVGVRVSDGGAKTFIVMVGSGKRRTIGKVGIITLSDARTEAKRILAEKTLGIEQQPDSVTFAAALTLFIEENYKDCTPRTKSEAKRLLERHFLPAFRTTDLPDVTDAQIGRQLAKLSDVPSEQLHAFRAIRTMLRWCTKPPRRYIRHSPLEGYDPPSQDKKRKRILSDDELVTVWRACTGMFGVIIRLIFLWGTRKGETGRMRRTWIAAQAGHNLNVPHGIMTIPGAYTKNGRAHAIPILPLAHSILGELTEEGDYLFPGRLNGDEHIRDGSWGKFKTALDKASGVTGWTVHDIRRTFRSLLARLGTPREIAEILLNHVSGANKSDLDEIYDQYDYLVEKRDALLKIEAHITALLARS